MIHNRRWSVHGSPPQLWRSWPDHVPWPTVRPGPAAVGVSVVTHQPVVASGLPSGTVNVTLGVGSVVSSMLPQYPVDLNTAGLPTSESTFEISTGTPMRTQTVLGRLRVV